MIRATITIQGRVQGVSYRSNARRKAAEYGLTGYVANQPDGSVQIVAEGDTTQIDRFVAWCSHGPKAAIVTQLRVDRTEATGEFRDFQIRR